MAGEEGDGVVDVAVRDRDAGVGEAADAGGDARDDAERHAGLDQRQRLLAAAAEHEGIAALEPQHALALARQLDQAARDVGLLGRRLAAALAGVFERPRRGAPASATSHDQRVIDDDVGVREAVQRAAA